MTGVKEILGEEFGKVTGVQISELSKTKNDDLLAIISDFKENYDTKWEDSLAEASTEVLGMIFSQMEKDESFSVSGVNDGDFAAELASLDFANLIGGPLNACVTAQTNASLSTVAFINEVGFKTDAATNERELVMADFSHKRKVLNPDYDSANPNSEQYIDEDIVVVLPFIALCSVPSFRIETCEIDFNVKLNSVYTKQIDTSFGVDASLAIDYYKAVKFDVSVSYKRSSSTGIKVEKEYSLGVKVKAANDEMPAGLEKVLNILAG